jgi:hypothetical protein
VINNYEGTGGKALLKLRPGHHRIKAEATGNAAEEWFVDAPPASSEDTGDPPTARHHSRTLASMIQAGMCTSGRTLAPPGPTALPRGLFAEFVAALNRLQATHGIEPIAAYIANCCCTNVKRLELPTPTVTLLGICATRHCTVQGKVPLAVSEV